MKFTKIVVLWVVLLLLVGCAQRITLDEYNRKCAETYKPTNTITGCVYYCGSKNGFDYVYFMPFLGMSDMAKIESGKLYVVTMPYTSDESQWVVVFPNFHRPSYILNGEIIPFELKLVPDKAPQKQVPYR